MPPPRMLSFVTRTLLNITVISVNDQCPLRYCVLYALFGIVSGLETFAPFYRQIILCASAGDVREERVSY